MTISAVNQNDYGDSFCLASCYLAIANYYGYGKTMQNLKDEKIVNSTTGSILKWGDYFVRSDSTTYDAAKVKAAIDKNTPVIIKGKSSRSDHYVVAYSYSGDTIKVMDPWGGKLGDLGSTTLKSWSAYYVCSKKK